MTINEFSKDLIKRLQKIYNTDEAASISNYLLTERLNLSRTQLYIKQDEELDYVILNTLTEDSIRLMNGEPIQYITNTAYFYGLNFYVDRNVLIPRQETEILVNTVCENFKNRKVNILDIGCGSGCISISLKANLPDANIFALDISKKALEISQKNAEINNTQITLAQHDILSNNALPFNEKFDIIVSNPPYVRNSEKTLMHKNVVDYEPSLALYVDDNDPLIYYKKILYIANQNDISYVIFEINEYLGQEMKNLCLKFGYKSSIMNDLNNKNRFIVAIK